MKILFLIPYPSGTAASQRFRFEQYLPFLKENGIDYSVSSFWDQKAWDILYKKGVVLGKAFAILRGIVRRYALLFTAFKYDRIFIHRELYPVGPQFVEFVLAKVYGKKIIFDFDDSIWLPNYAANNAKFAFIKSYGHVKKLCKYAYKLSVGNEFLAAYGRKYNSNVVINPTTIDTENYHNRIKDQNTKEFIIGWTGTHSTLRYLEEMLPIFDRLEKEFDFKLVIISDKNPEFMLKSFEFVKWQKETEIDDLLRFNIGLMPLTLDKWANGKCGFKALQYMSLGVPAIVSPVGVNTDIVEHGKNGYVCNTVEEWETSLRSVLSDKDKVKTVAQNSRKKIEEYYSVNSNKDNFIQLFD
ncbi:MAG: glycosyltransferase family 4 protein [Flavobacteriales bacterium]|nr:glycosyltransferase family 4 protein [Flavobacteriales bacterium]